MTKYRKSDVRDYVKGQMSRLTTLVGINPLTKDQTEEWLSMYQIAANASAFITLPEAPSLADETTVSLKRMDVVPNQGRVWQYEQQGERAILLPRGNVKIGRNVLDTDFGVVGLLEDYFKPKKRTAYTVDTLIAPWSHTWGGYYDYLFFVAAKLCRIKAALPEAVFRESLIAYPLMNTPFERDILNHIGVNLNKVVDSRTSNIHFNRCVMANNNNFFFPDPTDVQLLREQVTASMPPQTETGRRIYIQRTGRRRIVNETALIALLAKYNIQVVDDKPRSIAEQFAIYNSASFIIGPHGASFANLLWCRPGTHLVELFAENYIFDYYRYLAHLGDIKYSTYCNGRLNNTQYMNRSDDVFVSLEQLERSLDELLEYQPIQRRT